MQEFLSGAFTDLLTSVFQIVEERPNPERNLLQYLRNDRILAFVLFHKTAFYHSKVT